MYKRQHSHHYQHAKLALEAGRHVLCEKAFTANASQARELFALAEARGLFLGEAMWTRFLPMKAKLQQLLHDGAIGQEMCIRDSCQSIRSR